MDKGKGKPPIPPKPRNHKQQASKQANATSDFGGFPILPPPEPLFRRTDVTASYQGKAITPNSAELLENEGPPRANQVCKYYHDSNKICSWGLGCPDMHGIFGLQYRSPAAGQGVGVGPAAAEIVAPAAVDRGIQASGRVAPAGVDRGIQASGRVPPPLLSGRKRKAGVQVDDNGNSQASGSCKRQP